MEQEKIWVIISTVIVTAMLAGGIVYAMQKNRVNDLQDQMKVLEEKISLMESKEGEDSEDMFLELDDEFVEENKEDTNLGLENEDTGVDVPPEEERINVLFPKEGEKVKARNFYEIKWDNYNFTEPLAIELRAIIPGNKYPYSKIIAENIPAENTGSYTWKVTSEPAGNEYKIIIGVMGEYEAFSGASGLFEITDQVIEVYSPKLFEEIENPLEVTGRARKIFSEGSFVAKMRVESTVISENFRIYARDCDWMTGEWCNFEFGLEFDASKFKNKVAMLEFYEIDESDPSERDPRDSKEREKLVYKFNVVIK